MATNTKLPPPPATNGVITGPPKGIVGGNRKKQKRRAKQAAKSHSDAHPPPASGSQPVDYEYDEDPLGYGDEDDFDYSEAEQSWENYVAAHGGPNGYNLPPPPAGNKKKKNKKGSAMQHDYNPELLSNTLPPLPSPPPPPVGYQHHMPKAGRDQIWNTSTQQERQNIKEFWLGLSEEERKSLLKIEKEAVLRKMKQQQKHSCSCTVCGRKRTAIEEELEVLYEGYYEELESYAHHDHPPLPSTDGMMPDPLQHRRPHPLNVPPPNPHHKTSQLQEHFDDDDFSEDEDEEYDEELDSGEEVENIPRTTVPTDFFNFGQSLTVKGILTPWLEKLQYQLNNGANADNLLTVADDLMKNDGRKFIEMMEQLAERRMQRESDVEYAAAHPSHSAMYPPGDPYSHEDALAVGDEFDDDEASYDSQEEYDDELEEEDEMGGMTEEQRMEEGRRMFQIFAARMFEQRVLTAYREKVAAERQQKLLEELEDENKLEAQREAKKQRDAQKKKDKKKQQQQAKAEEKAQKQAEKDAEEARVREAEEKKLEEQRRRKEEQRKKKEDEKKKQDEERAKKEAEKIRRQQEEQQRREEAERKARDAKAKKDEARKREREEREARERDARERKAQEEKEKKEREEKVQAEKAAKERERSSQQGSQLSTHQQQQPPQIQKRPSQAGMVAVPGVYPKQTASGVSSPHPTVATPAIPKAPTPAKGRQTSHQGSLASSPKQSTSQVSSAPSKSSSPNSIAAQQQQAASQPRTVLQKHGNYQPASQPPQHPMPATSPPIQPPPGMPYPQQNHPPGFGGMPPMGYPGFQGQMMPNNMGQRGPMPMYQQQGMPQGSGRFGAPGMGGPPPGMMPPQRQGMPFQFDGSSSTQPPPGFPQQQSAPQQSPQQAPPIGPPQPIGSVPDAQRTSVQSHSRQHSASDKDRFEPAATQPIARPAPIQRPSSVKPQSNSDAEVSDLAGQLGSSALLDDSDEPILNNVTDNRTANLQSTARNNQMSSAAGFGAVGNAFGAPSWGNSSSQLFRQGSGLGQQNWGGLPSSAMNSWNSNNAAFATNNAFGAIGGAQPRPTGAALPRPYRIRLAICQACKQLTNANRGEGDGFYPVQVVLRQIEHNRSLLDAMPATKEIRELCDTEGNSQNGGGVIEVRENQPNSSTDFSVSWVPDASTPDNQVRGGLPGLGEVGSPLQNKASPSSFGFGVGRGSAAPGASTQGFQTLGSLRSPSGFN